MKNRDLRVMYFEINELATILKIFRGVIEYIGDARSISGNSGYVYDR